MPVTYSTDVWWHSRIVRINTVTPLNTPSLRVKLYYLRLRVSSHWLLGIIGHQEDRREAGGHRAACYELLTVIISCSKRFTRFIRFLFFGNTKLVSGRSSTMFLCRTGKLSAAALDQAFKSSGSFLVQVKANRLRDVTLTLRKGYTFQRYRCFCVSVGGLDATPVHLGKQLQPGRQPVRNRDLSCAFNWGHLDRVATIAVNLSKRGQSEGGNVDIITQPLVHVNRRHGSRGEPVGNGLFTGNWGVSSRLCSTGTMQTRALSTKKSDAGEEQKANNKGVI